MRNILTREDMRDGDHLKMWDGFDEFNVPVGNGIYFPIVRCTSKRKGSFLYNPSALPWGTQLEARNFTFSSQSNVLSFEVTQRAYGRLRVGLKEGGPVFKTLAPWQLWQPATHEVSWDGKDSAGYRSVLKQKKLSYSFDAFSLPPNAIIVSNAETAKNIDKKNYATYPVHPAGSSPVSYFALEAGSLGAEPELNVSWNDTKKKKGRVILKGKISCTVSFADITRRSATLESGTELLLYVDDKYVTEMPVDGLPATVGFDSREFSNGKHIVTINLLTTDDRAGIFVQKVMIKN